jgi:hypothetical protein
LPRPFSAAIMSRRRESSVMASGLSALVGVIAESVPNRTLRDQA